MDIVIKPWQQAYLDAFSIRKQVFIEEQGVPEAMEVDEFDSLAQHALAYVDTLIVGTARLHLLTDQHAQIGRMAVLSAFRGRGIGKALLTSLISLATIAGATKVSLHAQVSAIPFYERLGFATAGAIYDEAGIPHRNMMLLLT